MNGNATILVNGTPYRVTPDAKIPAGEWLISAIADGVPAHWLTLRVEGATSPALPGSSNGTLRRVVASGRYTIGWNGRPPSKTNMRVNVECVAATKPEEPRPTVRPTRFGVCCENGLNKQTANDREGVAIFDTLSFVTSDWDRKNNKPAIGGAEVPELQRLRSLNPTAYVVCRCWNGWPMPYRNWTDANLDAYAEWLATEVAPYVDLFEGPNEPGGAEYNTDPDRTKPEGRARVNAQWNRIAKRLRTTGKPVSTPAWLQFAHAMEAVDQCTDCNAASWHPYNASDAQLDQFNAKAGPDRLVVFTEWGEQADLKTPERQAEANERIRKRHVGRVDISLLYAWRPAKAGHDWMGAYTFAGAPRAPMIAWMREKMANRKPEQPTPTTPTVTLTADQQAVFDAINALRAKAGLPACTHDASLAAIAQTALDQPGELMAHPAAAGGRGFGMFDDSIAVLLADMPTNSTNEGVIARQKILDPSHKRLGVGIGDGGFYAVFGV